MKEITHDLNHDLKIYCRHNPLWILKDKVSVLSTWDI